MTFDQLNKLKDLFKNQVAINEDNVMQKSLEISSLYSQYLNIFINEINIKKQIQADKNKLYSNLYHKYKHESDYSMDSQKEIDVYVNGDDAYYKKCLELNNQEVITDFLEKSLEILNKTGYSIKSYIELLKIRNGI